MFNKKQKSCVKRIHLVADDGLYTEKLGSCLSIQGKMCRFLNPFRNGSWQHNMSFVKYIYSSWECFRSEVNLEPR